MSRRGRDEIHGSNPPDLPRKPSNGHASSARSRIPRVAPGHHPPGSLIRPVDRGLHLTEVIGSDLEWRGSTAAPP
jgi:hypothetical protein